MGIASIILGVISILLALIQTFKEPLATILAGGNELNIYASARLIAQVTDLTPLLAIPGIILGAISSVRGRIEPKTNNYGIAGVIFNSSVMLWLLFWGLKTFLSIK